MQILGALGHYIGRFLGHVLSERSARDHAPHAAPTAGPNATVRELTHLMNTYQINRIPIVESRRLIGIVTRADVLRALTRPDAAITEEVRWRLEHDLWIDLKGVQVSTAGGVVALTGEVDTRSDAELAVRWAGATDGVVAVDSSRLHYRIDDGRLKVRTDRLR